MICCPSGCDPLIGVNPPQLAFNSIEVLVTCQNPLDKIYLLKTGRSN
jgi:hypothetical protein